MRSRSGPIETSTKPAGSSGRDIAGALSPSAVCSVACGRHVVAHGALSAAAASAIAACTTATSDSPIRSTIVTFSRNSACASAGKLRSSGSGPSEPMTRPSSSSPASCSATSVCPTWWRDSVPQSSSVRIAAFATTLIATFSTPRFSVKARPMTLTPCGRPRSVASVSLASVQTATGASRSITS